LPRVDDVACVVVGADSAAYRRALRGRHWTEERRSRDVVACLGLMSLLLVDQRFRLMRACSPDRVGSCVPMARRGALRLLHGSALHQRLDVVVELLLLRICRLGQIT
jgi:hypothetical protein